MRTLVEKGMPLAVGAVEDRKLFAGHLHGLRILRELNQREDGRPVPAEQGKQV
jgi:hypothetical protein